MRMRRILLFLTRTVTTNLPKRKSPSAMILPIPSESPALLAKRITGLQERFRIETGSTKTRIVTHFPNLPRISSLPLSKKKRTKPEEKAGSFNMGNLTKLFVLVAMVSLSETRAWFAPYEQDDVAEPASSRSTKRPEEEDDFGVEVFPPRSGRAMAPATTTTPAPPARTRPPTTAPPPRPSYDKPAPPRKVLDHSYDYPEFVAAPKPTPPIGQSYFGVDLGSLSDSEGSGSGQESPAPPATTDSATSSSPVLPEEGSAPTDRENKTTGPHSSIAALTLQLIKMLRWPLMAVVLIAVLGTCLLSGCSVGLLGRQCFETNAHRRSVAPPKPRVDQDISGEGLSLQTRRAIAKGKVPKNLKADGTEASGEGDVDHVRVVRETDV